MQMRKGLAGPSSIATIATRAIANKGATMIVLFAPPHLGPTGGANQLTTTVVFQDQSGTT